MTDHELTNEPAAPDSEGVDTDLAGDDSTTVSTSQRPAGLARIAVTAAVAVGLVGVAGLSMVPGSRASVPTVPESLSPRTTAVCSTAPNDPRGTKILAAGLGVGTLTVTEFGAPAPLAQLPAEGLIDRTGTARPFAVVATDAMAAQSGGVLLAQATSGVDRGLAAQACELAGTSHWFVGLGAGGEQFSTIVVSNPDAQAAEVELRLTGPEGAIAAPGSSGIPVPPHASVAIGLDSLVDAEGPLAVEVRATGGRVRAIAVDRHRQGAQPAGTEWVMPTSAPHTMAVIAGIPAGEGAREIVVANPGERTTTVTVEALGADGPFVLQGADAIEVPPSSTVRVALDTALGGEGLGLRVRSEQPVVAAVVSTVTGNNLAPDTTTATSVDPVMDSGILPLVAAANIGGDVQVSNGGSETAAATVVVRDATGAEVSRSDLELGAGTTRGVAVTGSGRWAEVITAAPGIYAAVVLTSPRSGVAAATWLPVVSSRTAAAMPPAQTDPRLAR